MATNDPNFPAVQWLSPLEAWNSPTFMPGSPHNLPKEANIAQATNTAQYSFSFDGATINAREPYRYASLQDVSFTVGTTSIKFLDAPIGKRNMLGFRNASSGTQNIFVSFGAQASTSAWLKLTPGQLVLFDAVVPQDDLYVIADAAGAVIAYAYSTFGG
jgi:hypothetical protein